MRYATESKFAVLHTKDLDNKNRYLYSIPGSFSIAKTVDLVLFPSYLFEKSNTISIKHFDKIETFNQLMANVKCFETKRELLHSISMIASSANAYCVEYNNLECLGAFLNNLVTTQIDEV